MINDIDTILADIANLEEIRKSIPMAVTTYHLSKAVKVLGYYRAK